MAFEDLHEIAEMFTGLVAFEYTRSKGHRVFRPQLVEYLPPDELAAKREAQRLYMRRRRSDATERAQLTEAERERVRTTGREEENKRYRRWYAARGQEKRAAMQQEKTERRRDRYQLDEEYRERVKERNRLSARRRRAVTAPERVKDQCGRK